MSSTAPLLDLQDLRVSFRTPSGTVDAVRGVSLTVMPGEILGVVGESGSGKSTTALAIAGLTPTGAQVSFARLSVAGHEMASPGPDDWRRLRRDVLGYVFQSPMRALNPRLTVGASIREAVPPEERGIVSAYHRAMDLMEQVGINRPRERLRQYPHELSGGLAQRVVIALALARRPKLLIADEPTTALDVSVQAQILNLIDELRAGLGLGVLLVSHDLGVIGDRADRVAVMYSGEVVETGPCANVVRMPRHEYTRRLLAATPARLMAGHEPGRVATNADGRRPRPLIEAVSVSRSFAEGGFRLPWQAERRRAAVLNVTLDVRPGESVGIVGESGSGKTTLARMMVGLDRPDEGAICFDGRDVTGFSASERAKLRRDVQFVFQDNGAALDPRFTVGDSITEAIGRGVPVAERQQRLERVLADVDLPVDFALRRPHQLSGGQRQRVGIARALISNPRLIIADEPVSALDVSVQATILKLLSRLRAERGMSYLVISHDIGVIRFICDRVAVIYRGDLVEFDTTEAVLNKPRHAYTKQLLDAVPGRRLSI